MNGIGTFDDNANAASKLEFQECGAIHCGGCDFEAGHSRKAAASSIIHECTKVTAVNILIIVIIEMVVKVLVQKIQK
jgi:hypothetical protein